MCDIDICLNDHMPWRVEFEIDSNRWVGHLHLYKNRMKLVTFFASRT